MRLQINKTYVTMCGEIVRIISARGRGDLYIGLVKGWAYDTIVYYTEDGMVWLPGGSRNDDVPNKYDIRNEEAL